MLEFTSIESYRIKDKGTVYKVRAPFAFSDRSVFIGDVKIDGVVRNVTAVESWALHTISAGTEIGLLVPDGQGG